MLDPVLLPPYRGATKVAQQVRLAMAGDPDIDDAEETPPGANVRGAAVAEDRSAATRVTVSGPAELLGTEGSLRVASVGQTSGAAPDPWPDLVQKSTL